MQYESPISSDFQVMAKIKVFTKVGKNSKSRSQGQNFWFHVKGVNTHVQYEIPITSGYGQG